jgi:hypothetical protein
MGRTSKLPRTTREPALDHRVICSLTALSEVIRDSTWTGPAVVVPVGNWKAIRSPYTPGSIRAATQAIMFGRPSGTIGWMRTNSASSSPGMRMIT